MAPLSALPDHLNSREEIEANFPDDDQYGNTWYGKAFRWFKKETRGYRAFGPRATEWWARWREQPIVLLAVRGKGAWRWESFISGDVLDFREPFEDLTKYNYYLSRIQPYCRWHVAVQWPLQVTFHCYWKASTVPSVTQARIETSYTDMIAGYGPTHLDKDWVYWIFSFFVGGRWK